MSAAPRSFPHFSPVPIDPDMTLAEAAEVYLQLRTSGGQARYIKRTTEHSYRQYITTLKLFFGNTKLKDITWLRMKAYQQARVDGAPPFIRRRRPFEEPGPCPAKPAKANQELQLLRLLKMRAQCWTQTDATYYERLQEPESDLPRALTLKEEKQWLAASASNPRWAVVHWYSLLSFHTCLSSNEIRALRIRDIDLVSEVLTVPNEGAKNPYRRRTIPLDPDAVWAAERLLERAHSLGAADPQDYLFPFRDIRGNRYLPSRPMTVHGIRALWEEVRAATGFKSFRPYDTRHTGITRLMEAGQSMNIVMAFAGHVNEKMTRHYTHISEQAKMRAFQEGQRFRYADLPGAAPTPRRVAAEPAAPVVAKMPPSAPEPMPQQTTHNFFFTTTTR